MPKKLRKAIKVKKPTTEELLFARYNQGRADAKWELENGIRTRVNAVADRRRQAFQDYQGAINAAHGQAFVKLIATLDKLDREVNP